MKVTCPKCLKELDDAKQTTICPHERFISDEIAAQKDLAFSLLRKTVYFAHLPEGEGFQVESIGHDGMISLRGMVGSFAPHLFVVKEEGSK
jgi:hypothetical protein